MSGAVKLTLRDGTRTSVPANAIADIEPDGRGALVRLLSGETLSATQDARMLDVRWRAAMADREPALPPAAIEEPSRASEPEVAERRRENGPPPSRVKRMKRFLQGRVSQGAFLIGGVHLAPAKKD